MVRKGINYNKTFRNQDINVVGEVVDEVCVTVAPLTYIDVDQLPTFQRINLGWMFEMLIGNIIENKRRTVFRRGPPKSKGRPRNPDKHGRHTDGSRV